MKKLYELVVVFDPDASNDTVKTTRAKVEKRVDIQQTDDMGILPLAYSLKGHDQAYFVSYAIEIDASEIDELKSNLKLEKHVAKYSLFAMREGEDLLQFADLKKQFTEIESNEEEALANVDHGDDPLEGDEDDKDDDSDDQQLDQKESSTE